jgi:hypothetical protein
LRIERAPRDAGLNAKDIHEARIRSDRPPSSLSDWGFDLREAPSVLSQIVE